MPATPIPAEAAGLPDFAAPPPAESADVFSLSSHARAREALELGLAMKEPGFNVFVVGDDRSGRMTATLAFLKDEMKKRSAPSDWLYVNNFRRPHRPRPLAAPAGVGRAFRDRMEKLVPQIREGLAHAFGEETTQSELRKEQEALATEIAKRIESLREDARAAGLDLAQTPQGMQVVRAGGENAPDWMSLPEEERRRIETAGREIGLKLGEFNRWAAERQQDVAERAQGMSKEIASEAIAVLVDGVKVEFAEHMNLSRWLDELKADAADHLQFFAPLPPGQPPPPGYDPPERRYAVNLLVDHSDDAHPNVVLEPNPTYQNLFGRMEYRQVGGIVETDFSLIRSGSLHRANGGVLVLRADALARQGAAWEFLKGAIRDGVAQMEELHRFGGIPIAGAPRPKEIPLNVKVIVVGSPHWYYTFFSADPDFQAYFKVKADIDPDMEASEENLRGLGAVAQAMAAERGACACSEAALGELFALSSRWAGDRTKLSSRFERMDDLIAEAVVIARRAGRSDAIEIDDIRAARDARERRNSRIEDRSQEAIRRGGIKIDVTGRVIGQVNGLTVRDVGDHAFGGPSRVTARTSIGRKGVVNIERDVAMGGPIQQKAAMILQGYFAGQFARRMPLSFTASMTFEQNYGGVEGDSASLAEAVAIVSDLAETPVRQDIAITGSMNQRGVAQAVGGVHHKIEGFFRACQEAGALTGEQGCIVPASNADQLILGHDVVAAMEAGDFHIWTVERLEDALELMLGLPAGDVDAAGDYPLDSIFGRVQSRLQTFNQQLLRAERLMT